MKRITADECKAAYETVGLDPMKSGFADSLGRSCCGLTAVVVHRGLLPKSVLFRGPGEPGLSRADEVEIVAVREFGREYVKGFLLGFDGWKRPEGEMPADLTNGFDDGVAASAAANWGQENS